jgi:hypothetical protein
MADGRNFTDYRTRCSQLDQMNHQNGGVQSNYDMRMFMQQNADNLMLQNRMASMQANDCAPCYNNNGNGTMLPEQSLVECDEKVCRILPNPLDVDQNGLGQGRKYNSKTPSMVYYPIEGISKGGHDKYGSAM